MKPGPAVLFLSLLTVPTAAAGQGLGSRITGGGDGVVRMSFPARPGVEICDDGFDLFGRRSGRRGEGWRGESCAPGPVVVEVRVRDGEVRDVEVLDRRHPRAPEARDLGTVQPHDAVAFLTQTARRGVGDAVFPILLADVEDAWKEVMALAEDRGVTGDVRRTALFWVGQEAAEAATEGLAEVASDEEEDREVREAAVFALSQRPAAEGVPILMEVARSAREPSTRRSAFFWLAQSRDARVVSFFRQVLLGGRGG